ncbi:polysaccharide biosynthesis protein [Flavobacterium sediminis]|uniref:Polysaccharide biosynthesis protein n=1 Tax=Flavobacterium sediminis TaxID=2201181 RepID=A0A2U8QT76_9FLAO|nr:nucleoside-diphosphate sugar epimerase/dehydratase [Flavobacterium sediminis]AWM13045.1 polysaccharide biosynthesis protein [Flavobacterium sediminis]
MSKDFFENRFTNLGYLPRWIIFCIDIGILIIASFLTHYIVQNLTLRNYDTYSMVVRYGIIIFANIFSFVVYRTYAGIIRHSSFVDAYKLLFSTFTALIILVTLNYLHYFIDGAKIFLIPSLVIYFVISFILLLAFRISIKFLFEKYLIPINAGQLTRVAIYGSGANSISLANAINVEQPKRFILVGFIDTKKSRLNKEVLGVPIVYKKKGIASILRFLNADAIIISDKNISNEEKLEIVEECLEYNYKILTAPTIVDWKDQREISKSLKKFEIKDLLERPPIVLDNQKIVSQIQNKVLLITGAAGSIGSEIVNQVLLFKPKKIVLLDQAETPLHHLSIELGKSDSQTEIIPMVADIKDKRILEFLFDKYRPSIVYHAAAYKHVPLMEENPYQAIVTNVLGTKNLADVSVKYEVDRFVMVSTDKAVNPSNIMGASKRIAEIYVQTLYFNAQREHKECTTKFITTRFGNVLGSNGSVVPLFTKQIQEGGPVTITHPDIIRYFMTIPEACQLVLEAGSMGQGGEIYIFDMGKPVKIIDLARKMIRLAGYVPDKEIPIKIVGLRPGEKLYEELLNDSAKTLPTHHEKIMIAVEKSELDFEDVKQYIQKFNNLSEDLKTEEMVRLMKEIVPEFKSMNSQFEKLDVVN